MKKDTILVTGSSGFLGTWLQKKLGAEKYNIFLTASKNYPNLNIHKLDLTDFKETNDIVSKVKPSIIYHLGAIVDLSRNYNTAIKCFDINLKGTLNLLESLRKNVPKKFILASTEEVYGKGSIPFKESQQLFPPSPYSISKIASEQLSNQYAHELNFRLTIFRIATMYGPENHSNRFISEIIIKALQNEDIPINSGQKKRDYVYVEDVAKALIDILDQNQNNPSEIYNLGFGKSYSLRYLVDLIIKLSNSSSTIRFNSIPERAQEADEWLLDISKIHNVLGWEPKISLEEGLIETIKYYKDNLV